ncbi:MAG TPA: type II secretion system F family protein [Clostridia bacterium]|nr:type II secretion system F family protein [Clostridia bacterium]HPQ47070.1 type II secretion system F family protein [Clostridia bacterium]HRX41298.1 type II secretion system F family protein [Clostridia bacterium]
MAFAIYLTAVGVLFVFSKCTRSKDAPLHGIYTKGIYPAVRAVVSLFIKGGSSMSSADFMALYGNTGNKEQLITEMSVRISSLILFLAVPSAVISFSSPGTTENLIALSIAAMGYFVPAFDLKQRAISARESILRDFPVFCMDLAVLTKSGLGLERAWEKALKSKDGSSFYREARLMHLRMETGVSLEQSIISFARRLCIPEIYSFATVVSQSVKSGGSGTADIIREFAVQGWNDRCQRAREKCEKASVKMVFPLAMGLAGVILIVGFPAFAAMKGMI